MGHSERAALLAASGPSGRGHEAVLVEVGGGIRGYSAAAARSWTGNADEICPGCGGADAGAVAEPDPRRAVHVRGAVAAAHADRAGPAQRHPRAGQLGRGGGWSSRRRRRHRRSTTCRRSPATRGAARCVPGGTVGPDGLRAEHEVTNVGDQPARSASPCTRTCGCPGWRSTTSAAGAGPQPGAGWTGGCCRRGARSPAPSTTTPAPAGSATAVLDTAFGDIDPRRRRRSAVTLAAPDDVGGRDGSGRTGSSAGGRCSPGTPCPASGSAGRWRSSR